jgi:S1-C subfamily serine protease
MPGNRGEADLLAEKLSQKEERFRKGWGGEFPPPFVIPQLLQRGRVIRPWVGIHGKLVKKKSLAIIIPLMDGFLAETVGPGSPAEQGGVRGGNLPIAIVGAEFLLGGNIITAMNGQSLGDSKKFLGLVRSLKVGDKVTLFLYIAR